MPVSTLVSALYMWPFSCFSTIINSFPGKLVQSTGSSCVLGEDFLYYWLHRFDHEIRFFWAVHVTHHSSEHMNFSVGFRSSVFQPLYRFIYFIPLAWLGFRPLDIVFIYSATQIWGIFVHTELIRKWDGWNIFLLLLPITGFIMLPIQNTWIKTWACS